MLRAVINGEVLREVINGEVLREVINGEVRIPNLDVKSES